MSDQLQLRPRFPVPKVVAYETSDFSEIIKGLPFGEQL